ncbi:C-type lectin domain family 2 member D5-like isoform 2-T2 [Acridotheres tristis]
MGHPLGCTAVPEADLQKAFPALLMCPEQGTDCCKQRDSGCELDGDAICERAVSDDVENGICTRDGSVREPLDPKCTSASGHVHRNILRRLPGEWFSCHPVLTSALIVLLVLVLALAVALAVQSAPQLPVPPATPQVLVLGCPRGWVGYNGVCYYLSNDSRSWEQSLERCSELGASLAILKDEEMDLFFRLRGNGDYWLGLRSRGEQLQWEDGSSFSSSVPVLGNSDCLYLSDDKFRSVTCSNLQPYLCSKARAPL